MFYNSNTYTTIVNSVFLIEKPVLTVFKKIIYVKIAPHTNEFITFNFLLHTYQNQNKSKTKMYSISLNCEFKVHVLVLNISEIKGKMSHLNIYF